MSLLNPNKKIYGESGTEIWSGLLSNPLNVGHFVFKKLH